MNKRVLSPYDCDLCAMIEDITKQEIEVTASNTSIRLSWSQNGSDGKDITEWQRIEALKKAIRGRLGDRFIKFLYADGVQSIYMKYDPEEYSEEISTHLTDPDYTAGTRYCRPLLEVDAIQFLRDNVEEVLRFVGGGTVTTPRYPNAKSLLSFSNNNGLYLVVTEGWYILKNMEGKFYTRSEKDFKKEFEPKKATKKSNNAGCGSCLHFINERTKGIGYCTIFKSEQRCVELKCQKYKPHLIRKELPNER